MANFGFVNIGAWQPDQVADWLKGLDDVLLPYMSCFVDANITGKRLLCVNHYDLTQIGVTKLGHQEMILEAIDIMSMLHYELEAENLQSLSLKVGCQANSLRNEVKTLRTIYPDNKLQMNGNVEGVCGKFPLSLLTTVSSVTHAIKNIASWLDRSPFDGSDGYIKKRNKLVLLGLDLVTAAQGENNPQNRDTIITSCASLVELCDGLVRESKDPLTIQPASLELATIRKKPEDELGMHIQSTYNGMHIIEGIKEQSAADLCGKIEEGDEVIQVNYQTVVGWQLKKLVAVLKENQKEVTLTLKKRPHHANPFGNNANKRKNANKMKTSTFPNRIRQRSKKGDRGSRAHIQEFLNQLPPPSEPFSESCREEASDNEAEVFQDQNESLEYQLDAKHRRATVSGGSPTLKRPQIKITGYSPKGRPRSAENPTSIPAHSSEDSAGSVTPEGSPSSPTPNMRNKLKVSSPSEDFSTKSLDRKLDMLRQQRRNGAESPRRRKASELAAKEIAGEAKGSPRLVRITRLDSTRRSLDIPPAGSSDSDVASNDERPQSMATSYTVNIVGGVAQRMPSTKVSDLHTPNTSILRTSKKTFRRVGANRRISCKDLGHGDCQGWLWKKREASSGMLSGKWTKRWFILKKHNLYYYKQQEDMKAQGIVYLPGFQISPAPEIKSKKFAFKAHHPGTTFYFAAERQDDMGKWMNKMGLAAIVFDVGNLNTTAGFMKPEQAMAASIPLESYYSESDDENDSPSKSDSASSTPQHCASPLPEGASEDGHQVDPDLVDVYRNIKRAELSLDGANKKRRRTSMLSRPSKLDMRNSSEVMISKKLSSLERTLKDRQKELFAIEALLAREDTLTSEELKNFKEGNPEVIEHIYSDQASSSTTQSDEDHTETESLQSGD